MKPLTTAEKAELKKLIDAGGQLPDVWISKLFPGGVATQATQDAIGKEYRLVYEGKLTREEVLAQTPAAPWQLVRSFCDERPFEDGWQNLLVWGDNLLAMRELLADQRGPNRFGTRDKIKLVYIDPPFATRQDFMKDKEKAYKDKIIGSKFIEFLRRRLVLLRELMADDASVFVHLDTKKGHYIKAVLDEVFGEQFFRNEIVWKRQSAHNDAGKCGAIHDSIYFYTKGERWIWNDVRMPVSEEYLRQFFDQVDSTGQRYARGDLTAPGVTKDGDSGKPWRGIDVSQKGRHWAIPDEIIRRYSIEPTLNMQEKLDALDQADAIHWPKKGVPRLKRFASEVDGVPLQDVWTDIKLIHNQSVERVDYPTQKPEAIVARIINAASNPGDIVVDCFSGSGTTAAVAEKLKRRWVAMDCGKLAIYTTQKRLFSLTNCIGGQKKEQRIETERVSDWTDHVQHVPSILLVTEKARSGECDITMGLLHDLANLAAKHGMLRSDSALSLVCPENKCKLPPETLTESDGLGSKQIEVVLKNEEESAFKIRFNISFIVPKGKPEKETSLLVQKFALYRAGVYDMTQIQSLPWESYRTLVLKLFGVREHKHPRFGVAMDGYIRGDATLVWNYPENPKLRLDHDYVNDLHKMVRGKTDERIYVIAPVVAMGFMEDEVQVGKTTYVFLKVPVSVLMRLIEHGAPAALPQPMKEDDVNEVIDAVGFDFVSQPLVEYSIRKSDMTDGLLKSFMIEISLFKAQTLATDADDFRNFETLSMVMFDLNYDGDVFRLCEVHWGEELLKHAGGLDNATSLTVSIPSESFVGDQMMMILCDRYGNEKALVINKSEFKTVKREVKTAAAEKAATKKSAAKKSTNRKTSGGSR